MLLCCWWCLRSEAVELDSRRVDHRVLSCEVPASTTITAVSFDQWEPETANAALPASERSAVYCSWAGLPESSHRASWMSFGAGGKSSQRFGW